LAAAIALTRADFSTAATLEEDEESEDATDEDDETEDDDVCEDEDVSDEDEDALFPHPEIKVKAPIEKTTLANLIKLRRFVLIIELSSIGLRIDSSQM